MGIQGPLGYLLTVLLLSAAPAPKPSTEADLRAMLSQASGTVLLPPGIIELSRPLELPPGPTGLTLRGHSSGTTLRAASDFQGAALLIARSPKSLKVENLRFDGNRASLEVPKPVIPSDTAFADLYPASGLWLDNPDGASLSALTFREIVSFPVLVTRGHGVHLDHLVVQDSGSRNTLGRNNTTGGILFEEGVTDFSVRSSTFQRIRGNAVWTHSWHRSPRSSLGLIASNTFSEIGRDAIQIGHATEVTVENNQISRVGFPVAIVDVEGQGIPAAIDTAGNVDRTTYRRNRISEVNGKCFDLDGFHDSEVVENTCRNQGLASDYPTGHFGIVFNNTNPAMESRNVLVRANQISGMRFGGIFVIGAGHRLLDNKLLNLNTAHCNDTKLIQCVYVTAEPDMLRSGIYLGKGAERPAPAQHIEVRGNTITGYSIPDHCIVLAPGLRREDDTIGVNTCTATK